MLPLGLIAPNFNLMDSKTDKITSLNEIKGEIGTLIMFICNHCPFVLYVNGQLVKLANDYQKKGIGFVAINSNDILNYPQDSPKMMKKHAKIYGYPFPYLFDETQEIAKAYNAACTPDFYLFNSKLKLVYHGQLDNSRPSLNIPITGKDIRNAIESILSGKEVDKNQNPSMGCNIKWK